MRGSSSEADFRFRRLANAVSLLVESGRTTNGLAGVAHASGRPYRSACTAAMPFLSDREKSSSGAGSVTPFLTG